MEQTYNNLKPSYDNKVLKISHISKAADEIVHYIDDRRLGQTKSLKTRFEKFNDLCMGGIEPNAIYTIGGISGSGKSSFCNMLETDIIDLNPTEEVVVLSFNFEMLSSRQVGRKLSYKLKRTTSNLYSSTNKISENDMEIIKNTANGLKKYPIYYADTPGSVEEVTSTIRFFRNNIAKDKWLIIIMDHLLLAKNMGNRTNKDTISDLELLFMEEKKVGKTTIIQLAQMNRNIESRERITNPLIHYPQRSDISTADEIFHASDYLIVLHRPETLGILEYGPHGVPCSGLIYMHFLKNREGELRVLKFKNELWRNAITEDVPEDSEESNIIKKN